MSISRLRRVPRLVRVEGVDHERERLARARPLDPVHRRSGRPSRRCSPSRRRPGRFHARYAFMRGSCARPAQRLRQVVVELAPRHAVRPAPRPGTWPVDQLDPVELATGSACAPAAGCAGCRSRSRWSSPRLRSVTVHISPSMPTGSQPGCGGRSGQGCQPRNGYTRRPDMIERRAGIVGMPSGWAFRKRTPWRPSLSHAARPGARCRRRGRRAGCPSPRRPRSSAPASGPAAPLSAERGVVRARRLRRHAAGHAAIPSRAHRGGLPALADVDRADGVFLGELVEHLAHHVVHDALVVPEIVEERLKGRVSDLQLGGREVEPVGDRRPARSGAARRRQP